MLFDLTFKDNTTIQLFSPAIAGDPSPTATGDVTNSTYCYFELTEEMGYLNNLQSVTIPAYDNIKVEIRALVIPKVQLDAADFDIVTYKTVVPTVIAGQCKGIFDENWSLQKELKRRYEQSVGNSDYTYEPVNYVYIEAEPGVEVEVTY
jgi:hypothetical protein